MRWVKVSIYGREDACWFLLSKGEKDYSGGPFSVAEDG